MVEVKSGEQYYELFCHCYLRTQDQAVLNEARTLDEFPAQRYGHIEWESIENPTGDQESIGAFWDAVQAVRNWTESPDQDLVFTGSYGSGKTLMTALAYNYSPVPAIWISAPSFVATMASQFSLHDGSIERDREWLSNAPVVMFDDIGRGGIESSNGVRVNLYNIINFRYNNGLPTIYTTNKNYSGMKSIMPELASRMFERRPDGKRTVYPITVDDYREKKHAGDK